MKNLLVVNVTQLKLNNNKNAICCDVSTFVYLLVYYRSMINK